MINVEIGTLIHRPAWQVFDFVSKPQNDFQWQYGTLATASLTDGASEMGTFFRSVGHLLGRRIQGTFEVTEYELNRKYEFKSLSGPLHSWTSYTFAKAYEGTQFNLSMNACVVDFFKMDERILEKKIKKQLKENLSLLKELLEAGTALATF